MNKIKNDLNYKPAPILTNEKERLQAVSRTGAMYLDQSELYDVYCYLAKDITKCSVSWSGLIDKDNQYCLASDGFPEDAERTIPREQTFCQYALDKTEPFIIEDMQKNLIFKNHQLVKDGIVKFYAAFPIVTSDGYTLGTLCVSDDKVKKLKDHQIKLLKGLSSKMAYQLEIQENFRYKSAENLIKVLNKITDKIKNLSIKDVKIILKYFSNQSLDTFEKKFLVNINIIHILNDKFEITNFGNQLKSELSLDIGILKRIKNISKDGNELNLLFKKIKDR